MMVWCWPPKPNGYIVAFSPRVTEALAAHRGATLALELGFSNVVLEGNS